MLPPSDPLSHPDQKLLLLLQELQRQRTRSGSERPLYVAAPTRATTTTAARPPFIQSAQNANASISVDDDDDYCGGDDSPNTNAAITIQIDASISIIGDRNVITIPPVNVADNSSRSGSKTSSQNAGEENNNENQNSHTSAAQALNHLHAFQRTRYGFFAGLITDALRDALPQLTDNNNKAHAAENLARMVHLDVDAGIRVRGSGNVVCAAPRVRTPPSDEKKQMSREVPLGRQKRASSVSRESFSGMDSADNEC